MIAIAGQTALDRTTWPDGRCAHRLGGAPIFAAQALASFGSQAVVLTQGGDDELREPFRTTGLEVITGPSPRTTVYDVRLRGDGTWHESISALGVPFTPRDARTWMAPGLDRAFAVVCGSLWREDFPRATLAVLGQGRRLYLDGQGPARPCRLGPVLLEGPLRPALIEGVRVLKVSEHEARALFGVIDVTSAAATGVPIVVVTLGDRGAVVFADGAATEVPVVPVDVADTVGAGDAFLALMAAAESAGASPVDAVRLACDGVATLLQARRSAEAAIASSAA